MNTCWIDIYMTKAHIERMYATALSCETRAFALIHYFASRQNQISLFKL